MKKEEAYEESKVDPPPLRGDDGCGIGDDDRRAVRAHRPCRRQALDRFWDHWVPGANNASKALCEEWGAKEKVEVQIDYITSQGHKNLLTIAAESQAKSGHDILAFPTWQPQDHANNLEPVDDIMAELIKEHGKVNATVEYLGRANGNWLAVPATRRQPDQGALLAHRPA